MRESFGDGDGTWSEREAEIGRRLLGGRSSLPEVRAREEWTAAIRASERGKGGSWPMQRTMAGGREKGGYEKSL